MPTLSDLRNSKYLKRSDFPKPMLVTIASYEEVNVGMENAAPDMRWALHFKELLKPLVLNSTNGETIAAYVGSEDFDAWINARVWLYDDPTIMYAGKRVGGIRIKAPKPAPNPNHPLANVPAKAAPKPAPAPREPGEDEQPGCPVDENPPGSDEMPW